MKNILIVIHDMKIGGAQKSLLSFLQSLDASPYGKDYNIHLMQISPDGPFISQLPPGVKIVEPPESLRWMGSKLTAKLLKEHFSLRALFHEAGWVIKKRLKLLPAEQNLQQQLWSCWKKAVPEMAGKYDAAISYIDGATNYYLIEKVRADKKVLWIHNEYQKLGYDSAFDKPYYDACDSIITISARCRDCIIQAFPQYEEKIHILENISNPEHIEEKSKADIGTEFDSFTGCKLLSVGRLNSQKGFDLAIRAAKILRDSGLRFLWIILGEGAERTALQKMIDELELNEYVRLVGARDNPYPYMRACDILVQTSRFEGKSIVLDEAKILCKPIVATNYTTVSSSVEHGTTGWIVDMAPEKIAEGILRLQKEPELMDTIRTNLQAQRKSPLRALEKYIETMFSYKDKN